LVADVAIQINRIVIENFLSVGLPVISFAPASFITAKNQKPVNFFFEPIKQALSLNLIPIIYGDVILDLKKGCCIFSSEKILSLLAKDMRKKFKVLRIIQCGATNGVYDEKGKTIPVITRKTFKNFKDTIGVSGATDVTGGMLHKVKESLSLALETGIETMIINASKKQELTRAILGKKPSGTIIVP
jgi:isopentenyl phosphate kinase